MKAFDPARGVKLEPAFGDVDRACKLTDAALYVYRETSQAARATFLREPSEMEFARPVPLFLGNETITEAETVVSEYDD